MEEQPIYLNNFELALQMKEAGFDKKCAFRAVNYSFHELVTRKNFEHLHIMYGYVKIPFATHYFSPACFSGSKETLYLPTLGEIDLPDFISIRKVWHFEGCYRYAFVNDLTNNPVDDNWHLSEIEARAHAWLWANKNKKEVQNG